MTRESDDEHWMRAVIAVARKAQAAGERRAGRKVDVIGPLLDDEAVELFSGGVL